MCGHCQQMETGRESLCCQEVTPLDLMVEEAGLSCATEHETFRVNCLDRRVIEVSLYEFVILQGPIDDNEEIHK